MKVKHKCDTLLLNLFINEREIAMYFVLCLVGFVLAFSAMGVKIQGDRLGLGVDLFSGKKTVAEEIGLDRLDGELRKQSRYFREKIM